MSEQNCNRDCLKNETEHSILCELYETKVISKNVILERYVTFELIKAKKHVFLIKSKIKGYTKGYAYGIQDALIFMANFLGLDPDSIGAEYN